MSDNVFDTVSDVISRRRNGFYYWNLDSALNEIRYAYSPDSLKTARATKLDFLNPQYRCAYLNHYFTSHTYCTKKTLYRWKENEFVKKWLGSIKKKKYINLCCLGGGPGSDVIGTYFFLDDLDIEVEFDGSILDKYVQWSNEYQEIQADYDKDDIYTLGDVEHVYFDFFQTPVEQYVLDNIHAADLITMVRFVSAVSYDRNWCQNRLSFLFESMKRGAMVLFIDNCNDDYSEIMEDAADSASLCFVDEIIDKNIKIPASEKRDMENENNLNTHPQHNPKISASLWRKPKHCR